MRIGRSTNDKEEASSRRQCSDEASFEGCPQTCQQPNEGKETSFIPTANEPTVATAIKEPAFAAAAAKEPAVTTITKGSSFTAIDEPRTRSKQTDAKTKQVRLRIVVCLRVLSPCLEKEV